MSLLELLLRVLFWGAIYLGAARIGAWITSSELRGLAHLAWDGLVGLALLISAWLLVGLWRFDTMSILAVAGAWVGLALFRTGTEPIRRFPRPQQGQTLPTRLAIVLLSLLVLGGLFWNRVPVLFFDSLAYHFAQPELWLLETRIVPYEWSLHSWFPPGMSVLYGVGLSLGGDAWANDANLLIGACLGLVTFDLGRRLWNPTAGLIALIALVSVPQILYALLIPAADLAHGTFVAACIGALLLWRKEPGQGWRQRAAWIAGGALLTKYLGLLVPLFVGGVVLGFLAWRSAGWRVGLRRTAAFGLPGLLLLCPWLIANAWYVGNPIAPILVEWLPVDGLAAGGASAFRHDARGGLPGIADVQALGPRLFGPTDATLYPGPAWGWPLSLWILVGLGVAIVDRSTRWVLCVSGALFLVWFTTFRWERFLIATTCFVCLAFAGAVAHYWGKSRAWKLGAVGLLALAIAYVPAHFQTTLRFTGAARLAEEGASSEQFIRDSWPQQRLIEDSGVHWKPREHKILLLGETRHYRLPVPRVAPSVFNTHPLTAALEDDPIRVLRQSGFTHLLVDWGWVQRSAEQYPSLRPLASSATKLDALVESLGAPLHTVDRSALYRIPEER